MMRIRMLVDMPKGAARNGRPWPAKGECADLPTADASHLVASGVAEPAEQEDAMPPTAPRRQRRKAKTEEE